MEGGRKMAYEDLITIDGQECGRGQRAKRGRFHPSTVHQMRKEEEDSYYDSFYRNGPGQRAIDHNDYRIQYRIIY